jgi:probable O-glycosylation ligase (exosortase A-associated)
MRNLLLIVAMAGVLLPMSAARPFVGVLVWSWVSFMNPHRMIWGVAGDLPWAVMIFTATVIGCMVAREPKQFRLNSMSVLIILFMVAVSLTSLVALAPSDMVEAKWEKVVKTFFFLLITMALLTDRVRIHALIWVMVISIGFFGVRGGAFALITGGNYRVFGPPDTMITDNNHLAAALLVTLPLMNYLRLQSRHRIVRIGLIGAMLLSLFAILGSYSRGALVGLGAAALFLWWNSSHKIASGVVFAAALVAAISFMPQSWTDRMSTISTSQQDESAEGRLMIWRASTKMALARPLTGAGFFGPYRQDIVSQFDPGVHARAVHSIYFEVIGEHGFPTFFIWLGMTLVGILNTVRIIRTARKVPELEWCRDLARMSQVSIIAYLVAGAFLSLCYWDFYFTLLVALTATQRIAAETLRQMAPVSAAAPGRHGVAPPRPAIAMTAPGE